jgi:hypothetical protein
MRIYDSEDFPKDWQDHTLMYLIFFILKFRFIQGFKLLIDLYALFELILLIRYFQKKLDKVKLNKEA